MSTTTPINPLERLDDLNAQLGNVQLELIQLLAAAGAKHQAIDAEYAPELNPRYQQAQALFDEIQGLSNAQRSNLLVKDKKSAKRNTGTVGWRSTPRLVLHVTEDELIARLRAMPQSISRRFVRVVRRHELNRDALLSSVNAELVASLEGVDIDRSDDFYAHPSAGVRMSTTAPYWPTLQGLSGPQALNTVLSKTDD